MAMLGISSGHYKDIELFSLSYVVCLSDFCNIPFKECFRVRGVVRPSTRLLRLYSRRVEDGSRF